MSARDATGSAAASTRIADATSDDDIARCHSVMAQLRPHVPLEGFVARIRRMEAEGFRLAYLADEVGVVRAVAGYRFLDKLVAGRVMYVDDLVTDAAARSHGHGAALLRWLEARARDEGCEYLELDSGVHRAGAHRFYFREGLHISSYHFRTAAFREQEAPRARDGGAA